MKKIFTFDGTTDALHSQQGEQIFYSCSVDLSAGSHESDFFSPSRAIQRPLMPQEGLRNLSG